MLFKSGQEVTLIRGKHRGQNATVLGADEANEQYAVQFGNGVVITTVANNVRAPGPVTLAAEDVIAALVGVRAQVTGEDARDAVAGVAGKLGLTLPE